MDSIIPAAVLSVSSLVNNLVSSVKNAKELAKQSSDPALKEQMADVFDSILDVKERVFELAHENSELREKLKQKDSVERDSGTGCFYKKGEIDPLCPKCFQGASKSSVYLRGEGGGLGWCVICINRFPYDQRKFA